MNLNFKPKTSKNDTLNPVYKYSLAESEPHSEDHSEEYLGEGDHEPLYESSQLDYNQIKPSEYSIKDDDKEVIEFSESETKFLTTLGNDLDINHVMDSKILISKHK